MSRDGLEGSSKEAMTESKTIRVSISQIQFPEMCPVCLEDPEDLVAITITQTPRVSKSDPNISSAWMSGRKETDVALAALQAAATFWVPACMKHGSRSVRSGRKRAIAWVSFFVFFYPILFSLLLLASAFHLNMPLLEPLFWLGVSTSLFLFSAAYGYYPRAFERAIKFLELDRASNAIILLIEDDEYRELFLELNNMHADVVQ
ncbi:MAG: hypothetical protein ACW99U_03590 [Candidatus Thorarchaeota archaeon]|jgi:hypothetical protein